MSTSGLEYIEMKTALALLSGYADVGIIDCQVRTSVCFSLVLYSLIFLIT